MEVVAKRKTGKLHFELKTLPMLIDSYFNTFLAENADIVADTESLAAYLGITREELFALERRKSVGRAVSIAKTRIAAVKKQLAYKGKLPATILTFDLRNDHGYRDKPEETMPYITVFKGSVPEWGE